MLFFKYKFSEKVSYFWMVHILFIIFKKVSLRKKEGKHELEQQAFLKKS